MGSHGRRETAFGDAAVAIPVPVEVHLDLAIEREVGMRSGRGWRFERAEAIRPWFALRLVFEQP